MRLLEFCLSATYMSCRGSMFQQTYGTAMGSPVSVTIAMAMITDTGDPMAKLQLGCGGHRRESPGNHRDPSQILEAVCGSHNLQPPQPCGSKHPIHCGGLEQWEVAFLRCLAGARNGWVNTHNCVWEAYPNELYLTPPLKLPVVRTLHTRAETISSTLQHKDEEVRHVRQALTNN